MLLEVWIDCAEIPPIQDSFAFSASSIRDFEDSLVLFFGFVYLTKKEVTRELYSDQMSMVGYQLTW